MNYNISEKIIRKGKVAQANSEVYEGVFVMSIWKI